jgi:hypothetical protein
VSGAYATIYGLGIAFGSEQAQLLGIPASDDPHPHAQPVGQGRLEAELARPFVAAATERGKRVPILKPVISIAIAGVLALSAYAHLDEGTRGTIASVREGGSWHTRRVPASPG